MSAGTVPPLPRPANWISVQAKLKEPSFTTEQITAYGQASRKTERDEIIAELEGMTCNNATARSAIRACIETIKEIK